MDSQDGQLDLADKKLVLIVNRKSGRRQGAAVIDLLRQQLAPAVQSLEVRMLGKGDDAAAIARRAVLDGADIVAALGGDGTQAAVAGALAGSDTLMALLPAGTFNYFARELGVGEDLASAVKTILEGRVRLISVGDLNGRIFLNNASFGAYPEILERRENHYSRWGRSRLGAYWSVLTALRDLRRPMHLVLTVQGEQRAWDTALAFVAKSAFQLETLGLDGADEVRRDHFALFVARARRARDLLGPALRLAFGRAARETDFELVIADDILIETRPARRLVAYDGEKGHMTGPFHLRVVPKALSVIVPLAEVK